MHSQFGFFLNRCLLKRPQKKYKLACQKDRPKIPFLFNWIIFHSEQNTLFQKSLHWPVYLVITQNVDGIPAQKEGYEVTSQDFKHSLSHLILISSYHASLQCFLFFQKTAYVTSHINWQNYPIRQTEMIGTLKEAQVLLKSSPFSQTCHYLASSFVTNFKNSLMPEWIFAHRLWYELSYKSTGKGRKRESVNIYSSWKATARFLSWKIEKKCNNLMLEKIMSHREKQ